MPLFCLVIFSPLASHAQTTVKTPAHPIKTVYDLPTLTNDQIHFMQLYASTQEAQFMFSKNPAYRDGQRIILTVNYAGLLDRHLKVSADATKELTSDADPDKQLEMYSKYTDRKAFFSSIGSLPPNPAYLQSEDHPDCPSAQELGLNKDEGGWANTQDLPLSHNSSKGPWVIRLSRKDDLPFLKNDPVSNAKGTYLTEAIEAIHCDPKTDVATIYIKPNIAQSFFRPGEVFPDYVTWNGLPGAVKPGVEDSDHRPFTLRDGYTVNIGLLLYDKDGPELYWASSAKPSGHQPDGLGVRLPSLLLVNGTGYADNTALLDGTRKSDEFLDLTLLNKRQIFTHDWRISSENYLATQTTDIKAKFGIGLYNEHRSTGQHWHTLTPFTSDGGSLRFVSSESCTTQGLSFDLFQKSGWYTFPHDASRYVPVSVDDVEKEPMLQVGLFYDYKWRADQRLLTNLGSDKNHHAAGLQAVYTAKRLSLGPSIPLELTAIAWALPNGMRGGYKVGNVASYVKAGVHIPLPASKKLNVSYTFGNNRDSGFAKQTGTWSVSVSGGL